MFSRRKKTKKIQSKTRSETKITHQMKPFTPSEVRAIKEVLSKNDDGGFQLLLFSIGVDAMLRGSDLIRLRVSDVTNSDGTATDEITVIQKKTGKPVTSWLTPQTVELLADLLIENAPYPDDYLFPGRMDHISLRTLERYVKKWAKSIGIKNLRDYSSHSIRRTRAAEIYDKTQNMAALQIALGHKNMASTSYYLGVDKLKTKEIVKGIEL